MIKELIKSFLNFRNIIENMKSNDYEINANFNFKKNIHEFDYKKSTMKNFNYMDKIEDNNSNIRIPSIKNISTSKFMNNMKYDKKNKKYFHEANPYIIDFVRNNNDFIENEQSKELVVSRAKATVNKNIDYKINKGITISSSIAYDDVEFNNLSKSKSNFVYKNKTFYKLPKLDELVKEQFIEDKHIPYFFSKDLVLIKKGMKAVLSEEASKINIIDDAFVPNFKVDNNEKGWLDFQVKYDVDNHSFNHNEIKNHQDEYIKPNDYVFVKKDLTCIEKVDNKLDELGASENKDGSFRIPMRHYATLGEFIYDIGGEKVLSDEYNKFLNELVGFEENTSYQLSDSIENEIKNAGVKLRPYQRSGIQWMIWLYRNHLHGILADDMGLGKTFQTIITIISCYEESKSKEHSLVIAPKSVIYHWVNEFKKLFPRINVVPYIGTKRNKSIFNQKGPIIFVTTYDMVSNDIDYFCKIPFHFIILDEASKVKNPNTKRSKAISTLNSFTRIALTGTPIENRISELWSIFNFILKGHLGSYYTFKNTFEKPIINDKNTKVKNNLIKKIRPFIKRRLKEDVAKDLPDKIPVEEYVYLTQEQKDLYIYIQSNDIQELRKKIENDEEVNYQFSILPILLKLKQICDHPAIYTKDNSSIFNRSNKYDLLFKKLAHIQSNSEHVVLFSHFLGMLDLIEKGCNKNNLSYIRIDGSTNDRQHLIDKFNNGDVDIAICSLMATGYGINLTKANHVIHIDRWWNPAIEDQATDRVHRIGQTKNVYVHQIINNDTLEEKIASLLNKKRELAKGIIGKSVSKGPKWSKEELLEILKPIN
tara:strand:- start:1420 stop:3876 length:2457 start_codon:yes stop_codon:yes gene_type:complete